ncbi:hypothetical protein WN51_09840 [Melipona quadrifasciata]|uniref:Uncharacterized protein n=1 Tax=Melipona quadrifasciata TaxID=166423 RepID=A0A0M9A6L4_9HYME|nr:hypothetical protein WN51_09840 [Melipona quadrifasciata]
MHNNPQFANSNDIVKYIYDKSPDWFQTLTTAVRDRFSNFSPNWDPWSEGAWQLFGLQCSTYLQKPEPPDLGYFPPLARPETQSR